MRKVLTVCAILAMASFPVRGQKIETEKPGRDQIVHVQTAMNHLTVVEVGEPAMPVASGSSAFRIEWRENKVFIQPTEPNVATNLFIWTASRRLNYELEPAGSVETMDFAIDQPGTGILSTRPIAPAAIVEPKPSTDAMLGGRPVRMNSFKEPKGRVLIFLKDVFEQNHQFFIRYAIRNGSSRAYAPGRPQVFVLNGQSWSGLTGLANHQLTKEETNSLKITQQQTVEVFDAQLRSPRVEPGQETVGVVGLTLPAKKTDGPTVLRLFFSSDGTGPVSATLVL